MNELHIYSFGEGSNPSLNCLYVRTLRAKCRHLRLWIKTRARFPLLLHQVAETGQDKFAILFDLFVGDRAKSIQEYSRGSFAGLGGFDKCTLEFDLGHCVAVGYARNR
jgi:hypothetical protein